MIDLDEMNRKVDELIEKETKFSLLFWLYKQRFKNKLKNFYNNHLTKK